jgi:two-component system, OmpR family, sensor histidine kinase KdpD
MSASLFCAGVAHSELSLPQPAALTPRPFPLSLRWLNPLQRYLGACGITVLCTALAYPLFGRMDPANIVMVYLLGVTAGGLWLGRGPSVLCAIANTAAFDYFFIPPRFSFYVAEPQYLLTLAGMIVVALVIANLMVNIRSQTQAAAGRERRTATLYAMCRELTAAPDAASIAAVAAVHVAAAVEGPAVLVLAGEERAAMPLIAYADAAIVRWVFEHGVSAGPGLQHSLNSPCRYLPLVGAERINAVVVVHPVPTTMPGSDSWNMLEALLGQIAMALERVRLAEVAAESRAAAERAALRNTLLASISHDLRAPLTAIAGAGCLVAQESTLLDSAKRRTLGQLIEVKARDMAELLGNVLELVRLESATALPKADWQSLEELVGAAVRQSVHRFDRRRVQCELPDDLPMLLVDGQLIRQLLSNLLENAVKYTPPGTTIVIRAVAAAELVMLTIEDDGPGFGAVAPERLFEKFERGQREGSVSGAGLGLAICRAIVRLHGGSIHATGRDGGGARFEILLPQSTAATSRVTPER